MDSTPARNRQKGGNSGVALFMVIAAISVLSILVTEFTYIAQINQKIAFDALDVVKAHYLAKSGFKLSLLRLKAYQNVKGVAKSLGGGATGALPKAMIEKIWSFPFFYPIPTNIPGLMPQDKDMIAKFQGASGLDGSFSALIESESSKYNLNLILAPFAPPAPSPSPSPTPPPLPGAPNPNPSTGPSPAPSFNPDEARHSLQDYLSALIQNKSEADETFSAEYRDYRIDDLMDAIVAWADLHYERKTQNNKEVIPMKRAPFYTVSELRMIPGMDDTLYDLFAPGLTASTTPGINVNTMKENTLRALVPGVTDEEVKQFFKDRDNEEEDNQFKDADGFFKYLQGHFNVFRNSDELIQQFKDTLNRRNLRIVVDETLFKITVKANINQTTRLLEAWVTLTDKKPTPGAPGAPGAPPPAPAAPTDPNHPPTPDAGLKITFMRIL